jgi:hypothetical protein
MTFAAYEMAGPNVTSWLHFNPATDTLFGTVPGMMNGTVQIAVVATDALHMSAIDLFNVAIAPVAAHLGPSIPRAASVSIMPPSTAGLLAFHS